MLIVRTVLDVTRDSIEPRVKNAWPSREDWTFSPFESARSGDILDVFGRYLLPLQVRTSSALLSLTLMVRPDPAHGTLRRALERLRTMVLGRRLPLSRSLSRDELLFLLDSLMCDSGRLLPGLVFGIYGKRGG